MTFLVEHESNGRDSTESRSWNRVALAANVMVTKNLMVHGKIWVPIVDGMHNKDIVDYCGFWQAGFQVLSDNKRFMGGVTIAKRKGWNLNANVTVDFAYRIFKQDNQYLYLQFYNGYGEGLLAYNRFHSQIRVGLLYGLNFSATIDETYNCKSMCLVALSVFAVACGDEERFRSAAR